MNQDFQIRHESKHYRPCNQYKHRFHYSHHRSLLGGRSVKLLLIFAHRHTPQHTLLVQKHCNYVRPLCMTDLEFTAMFMEVSS